MRKTLDGCGCLGRQICASRHELIFSAGHAWKRRQLAFGCGIGNFVCNCVASSAVGQVVFTVLAAVVTGLVMVAVAHKHFNGVTGDVFGATNELTRMVCAGCFVGGGCMGNCVGYGWRQRHPHETRRGEAAHQSLRQTRHRIRACSA